MAKSRSTVTWSSHRTSVIAGERKAATATERASLGSFLFERPLESTRTRTIAQWDYLPDDNAAFMRFHLRFKSGLRKAGMPEQ